MSRRSKPSFSIIGPGRLGRSLFLALVNAGFEPRTLFVRSDPSRHPVKAFGEVTLKQGLPVSSRELGEWVFITTPDDTIQTLAGSLGESQIDWTQHALIHCSGNLDSGILELPERKGAATASMHPLQTFTGESDGSEFREITVSLEGDPVLCSGLAEAVRLFGSQPLSLNRDQKRVLHVAAVFLSNYTVSLAKVADLLIRRELPEESYRILLPLLNRTVQNLNESDIGNSLTGPVSRGDAETVKQHLALLDENRDFPALYRQLGRVALDISGESGSLRPEAAESLRQLLRGDS